MHTKTSNQGNGACRGKAGWLCGGSYIGKLKKRGLAKDVIWKDGHWLQNSCYDITKKGIEVLNQNI